MITRVPVAPYGWQCEILKYFRDSLPFAFLITPLERVVRSDGTRIVMSESLSTIQELKKIRFTMTSKLILLSGLWAFWSFFYR